jgi:hypothetical protein
MAITPAAAPQPVDLRGVVPLLAERWSNPRGETHFKVVPCSWRSTLVLLDQPCGIRPKQTAGLPEPCR